MSPTSFSNRDISYVRRVAAATAVITASIIAAGANFLITKSTPTTAIRGENVIVAKSSSGTGIACDGWGNCRFSGGLVLDGVSISTGSTLIQSTADSRYVNTSGDTMTGSLTLNGNASAIRIIMDADNDVSRIFSFRTDNSPRWAFRVDDNEAGSNTGSNLAIRRYSDAGTVIDPTVMFFQRATGYVGVLTTTPKTNLDVRGTISGSTIYGKRCPAEYAIQYSASGTALAVNSGTTLVIPVAYTLSGYSLASFTATVDQAGVTGLTRFGIRNFNKGKRDLFSVNPSIDTAEASTTTAATAYVIDPAADDVGGGDKLVFDVKQIQTGSAPKGLSLFLRFSCP